VESSSVSSVGYDSEGSTLEIEFRSGRRYRYFAVPRRAFEELMTASSIGAYVNKRIKSRFPFSCSDDHDSTQ
jgi:lysyl-tRNA synthetase class 2